MRFETELLMSRELGWGCEAEVLFVFFRGKQNNFWVALTRTHTTHSRVSIGRWLVLVAVTGNTREGLGVCVCFLFVGVWLCGKSVNLQQLARCNKPWWMC